MSPQRSGTSTTNSFTRSSSSNIQAQFRTIKDYPKDLSQRLNHDASVIPRKETFQMNRDSTRKATLVASPFCDGHASARTGTANR